MIERFKDQYHWVLPGFILLIYTMTMWPTVGGGDSGELIAASYGWGIAHPPGYPLYTMIAKAFSYLPFSNVAWRVNLFSVITSVLASVLLLKFLLSWIQNIWVSTLVVGLFAFSPLVWRYSLLAEVFALNNLFVIATVWMAHRYFSKPSAGSAYGLAFVFGLGMSHHHTYVVVGLPLLGLVLWDGRDRWLSAGVVAKGLAFSFLGLLPYIYLPLASLDPAMVSWGDSSHWQGFLKHFLRKEYGTLQLATSGSQQSQFFAFLWMYGKDLLISTWGLVIPFGFLGVKKLAADQSQYRLFSRWLLATPLLYLLLFAALTNLPLQGELQIYRDIVSRFFPLAHIFFLCWMAAGMRELLIKRTVVEKYVVFPALVMLLLQVAWNYSSENQWGNYRVANFGRYLLKNLPDNTLFLSLSDINTNSIRYLQVCEGYRTDVVVLDRALMTFPWYKRVVEEHFPSVKLPGRRYAPAESGSYNLKSFFQANEASRPIYVTMMRQQGASREAKDRSWQELYELVPYGLSFMLQEKGEYQDLDEYMITARIFAPDIASEYVQPPQPASWDQVIYSSYWLAKDFYAGELLSRGADSKYAVRWLRVAVQALNDVIDTNPKVTAHHYKMLGLAYHWLIKRSVPESREYILRRKSAWKIYLTQTTERDKSYQQIKKIVDSGS